jgi:hypothetical protein
MKEYVKEKEKIGDKMTQVISAFLLLCSTKLLQQLRLYNA